MNGTDTSARSPGVVNREADARFRALAADRGLRLENRWVGGAVEHAWRQTRHVFEHFGVPIEGASVLELGCYMGGTATVLAALGARVTAVDVDLTSLEIASANAERYGAETIRFEHVTDLAGLPFRDGEFDVAVCYGVLEYVPHGELGRIKAEVARTVRDDGVIWVGGTSGRLWPREVHSGRWLTNYVPRIVDRAAFLSAGVQRGLWPWEVRQGFGPCDNLDLLDGGERFLAAARSRGMSLPKLAVLRLGIPLGRALGVWAGLLLPAMSVRLRKKRA